MKLNYKLGELIRNIDVKNKDLHCNNLKGLSMTKEFRASTSNIVVTDLSKYKIVAYKQFACDFMSAIRVHKMPIAFNSEMEEILVSPAYAVFEVIDENIILPEYLMMWFRRSEFDRYADFRSDAAIRGGYGWNELCETEIKLPSLEEQRKKVQAYKTITDRIELKKKINDNLLDSVQAIFRSWFVDYDPFDGVCPSNWETGCVEDIAEFFDSMRKPLSSLERTDMERIYPYYGAVSIVDYVDDYIFDGEYLLVSEDGIYVVDENGHPLIQHISGKFWANNHAHILKGKSGFNEDSLYLFLANTNMAPIVTGAAQPKINQANLKSFPITIPDSETMLKFNNIIQPFFDQRLTNESEIKKLEALQSLLLTRLVD